MSNKTGLVKDLIACYPIRYYIRILELDLRLFAEPRSSFLCASNLQRLLRS